jgi:hypothetical protein
LDLRAVRVWAAVDPLVGFLTALVWTAGFCSAVCSNLARWGVLDAGVGDGLPWSPLVARTGFGARLLDGSALMDRTGERLRLVLWGAGWGAGVAGGVPASLDFLIRVCARNVPALRDVTRVPTWTRLALGFDSGATGCGLDSTVLLSPPIGKTSIRRTSPARLIVALTIPITCLSINIIRP